MSKTPDSAPQLGGHEVVHALGTAANRQVVGSAGYPFLSQEPLAGQLGSAGNCGSPPGKFAVAGEVAVVHPQTRWG